MIGWRWIRNDFEASVHGLIELLSGETEKNNEIPHSGLAGVPVEIHIYKNGERSKCEIISDAFNILEYLLK